MKNKKSLDSRTFNLLRYGPMLINYQEIFINKESILLHRIFTIQQYKYSINQSNNIFNIPFKFKG